MNFCPLNEVVTPSNRIRQDFNVQAELELTDSIAHHGLFHPLLMRADKRTLIAGERRLRAIRNLEQAGVQIQFDGADVPLGQVPFVTIAEVDAITLLEAELHENLRRQQLTWQEEALATSALHKLRLAQNPRHTVNDTAQEVLGLDRTVDGIQFSVISEDIVVAEHLNDPDVAAASSRREAVKVVARKKEDTRRKKLAEEFGVIGNVANTTLIRGDLFDVIPTLPDGTFDLLIADPPYGVNAGEWDNQSAVQHSYSDKVEQSNEVYTFLAGTARRVLCSSSHAYLFCDVRRFEEVRSIFSSSGWRVWPWPLIWWKGTSNGLVPWPHHGPRRTFDCILFAINGDRRVNCIRPDVLEHSHDNTVEYGAHKPVELYQDLIQRSCVPGNRVLDPCCGTGPIIDAAKREHVWVTAIERDASAHGQAVERMKKL